MNYLYHMKKPNFKGSKLMPLNVLKKVYPGVYREQFKKYKDRKHLPKRAVPYLDCLWNDVLHMTAVHPRKLRKAHVEAGISRPWDLEWFKIDPRQLDSEKAIVYAYSRLHYEEDDTKYFVPFDVRDLGKYNEIPQEAIAYYREENINGRRPFEFHMVPYILYKGTLDVKDMEVIKV